MFRNHFVATLFIAASGLIATHAQAVQRTHVSAAFGSDSNTATNCTATAPCRFFQAAMTVTDTNGEVIVLDSGGYGAVTITKSLALIAPAGVYAGISVFPGANGVNIATAGVNVVLRGLSINGQGGGNGIVMTAGNKLTMENCTISNLTQSGINVNTGATVRVTDSIVRDNGGLGVYVQNGVKATITRTLVSGNGSAGIFVVGDTANSATSVDIADSTIDGNSASGLDAVSTNATATIKVSVRDSRALRNYIGLVMRSTAGGSASLYSSNNIVSNNNDVGISALSSGARVWATGNTVSGNNTGLFNFNALFESAGNNAVRDNGTDISGTVTVVSTR